MNRQIQEAVDGRSHLRCVLRSAHDISVCGLLAALGLPVHNWPGFGSSVIVELLRDIQSGGFQVRIVCHDGVPGHAGSSGKLLDVTVSLQAWHKTVEPLILTEAEYAQECALPAGTPNPPPHSW
mmetsp:Transcript_90349/g.251090  ORF Transcript_90349/g.251090 Transcript_90349/m.251090 type:complete len:124 (+) Transcript_90349:1100-1471(+)